MNVWLLHIGEDLPIDGSKRRFRYSRLADAFLKRGDRVLRWAPTFHHATKRQRADDNKRVSLGERYQVQLVRASSYKKNVSLARWLSYRQLASSIGGLMRCEKPPDLIVAAVPTLGWCQAAIEYGEHFGVPVVIDVRDLWPDVYLTALPKAFRRTGERLLAAATTTVQRICARADAIVGVSQSYVDWGLAHAGRDACGHDRAFALGHDKIELSTNERATEEAWLLRHGVDPNKAICVYAGLFETSYDLNTVTEAARLLEESGRDDIQFVLCGDGSQMPKVRKAVDKLSNVVALGWVGATTIAALMGWSKIGLAAYAPGAMQSLPNKPFEYLAGRLAVASSLPGELEELIRKRGIGQQYQPGDPRSLAKTIREMLHDSGRLESMRDRGESLFLSEYAAPKLYADFAQHLAGLVQQKSDWIHTTAA